MNDEEDNGVIEFNDGLMSSANNNDYKHNVSDNTTNVVKMFDNERIIMTRKVLLEILYAFNSNCDHCSDDIKFVISSMAIHLSKLFIHKGSSECGMQTCTSSNEYFMKMNLDYAL